MNLSRRKFLALLPAAFGAGTVMKAAGKKPFIMTVNGRVSPSALGPALPHEHVMVDFIGAGNIKPGRYQPDEVFNTVLPYLKKLK